jgi:hypothetical protein
MRAFKGRVEKGVVVLPEGAELPEGTVVTVTVGEVEMFRARVRAALVRNVKKRSRGRVTNPDAVGV